MKLPFKTTNVEPTEIAPGRMRTVEGHTIVQITAEELTRNKHRVLVGRTPEGKGIYQFLSDHPVAPPKLKEETKQDARRPSRAETPEFA